MSKILGVNYEGKEIKSYTVKLDCEYILYDKQVRKEAIFEIMATDRDKATSRAIEKAKNQLKSFPYIKDVFIKPIGRRKNESI